MSGWSANVLAATEGRLHFHTRVAINALSIVEREQALGAAHHAAHVDRLRVLGVSDDAALAAAIRSGDLDDRMDEVRELVWQSVRDKLAVANPMILLLFGFLHRSGSCDFGFLGHHN